MTIQARRLRRDLLEVVPDVFCQQIQLVNCYFVGHPGSEWILVDAGMGKGAASRIRRAAEQLHGPGARPRCIVVTHGHFDHVGGLPELAEAWDVPVFAHALEIPYLTGLSPYPPPDPTVGGGALARMSMLFPRGPIDLGDRVVPLPTDHRVPGLLGWRWIFTPGHTHGHVSLFRDADGVLLAGDAFVTTRQESALAAFRQVPEVNGPPRYYTSDWQSAQRSVEVLASLRPSVAATGHGLPMRGPELRRRLERLADEFSQRAVPRRGRYVRKPALADGNGIVHVPRPVLDPLLIPLGALVLGGLAALVLSRRKAVEEPLTTALVPRDEAPRPLEFRSARTSGTAIPPAPAGTPIPGLVPPSPEERGALRTEPSRPSDGIEGPVPGLLPRTRGNGDAGLI